MTLITTFENELRSAFPDLEVSVESLGNAYNASVFSNTEWYQFDILPSDNHVGLTYRKLDEIDFSGNDVVFDNIEEAITFLKNYRRKNKNSPNR
jgi:hypothetical protein